jgi:hypothetical protein
MSMNGKFEASYKVLEQVLYEMHRVPAARQSAFLARLRYMQRHDFPAARVGRGRKVAYDLEQIFQIAIAFEFLQFGAQPAQVMRLLRSAWPDILAALRCPPAGRVSARSIIAHYPVALDESGSELGIDDMASLDPVRIISFADLGDWVMADRPHDGASLAIVDLNRLQARVAGALKKAGIEDRALADALANFMGA